TVPKMLLDPLGQIVDRKKELRAAEGYEAIYDGLQNGLRSDRQQGLRQCLGKRMKALPPSTRHQHHPVLLSRELQKIRHGHETNDTASIIYQRKMAQAITPHNRQLRGSI